MAKKEAQAQILVYVTLNSERLAISHLTWILTISSDEQVRADFKFTDFRLDNQIPDSDFNFSPPDGVTRVDALQTPGRAGSAP